MNLREKRGQVTIFIIVAILIIILIALFFVFREKIFGVFSGAGSAGDYVEDCLHNSIQEAIFFNSLQGGYFLSPNSSIKYDFLLIPVYWDNSQDKRESKVPSVQDLEEQLGFAIEVSLDNCVNNLDEFKRQGYDVNIGRIQDVDVKIEQEKVSADINFPISLKKGDSVEEYREFSESVKFDYLGKYNIVKQAIELQNLTPNDIPLVQYSELAYDSDFIFESINLKNNTFLYSFTFNEQYKELNYTYAFAAKYNEVE